MTTYRRAHYTIRTGKLINEQIAIGKSLQQALDVVGYLAPSVPMFWRWLEEHPDFREQYDRARQLQADVHADRMLELGQEVIGKDPKLSGAYRVAKDILQWQAEVRNSGVYGRKKEAKKTTHMEPEKLRAEIKRLEKELGVAESKVVPLKAVEK